MPYGRRPSAEITCALLTRTGKYSVLITHPRQATVISLLQPQVLLIRIWLLSRQTTAYGYTAHVQAEITILEISVLTAEQVPRLHPLLH